MKVRGLVTALALVLTPVEVSVAGMSCMVLPDGPFCRAEGEGRGSDACDTATADSCTLLLRTLGPDAERPVVIAAYLYTFEKSSSEPTSTSGTWTEETNVADTVQGMVGAQALFEGAAFALGPTVKSLAIGEFSATSEKVSVRIEESTPHVRVVVNSGSGDEVHRLGEAVLRRSDVRAIPLLTRNGKKGVLVVAFKQVERKDLRSSEQYETITFQSPQVVKKGWFEAMKRRSP